MTQTVDNNVIFDVFNSTFDTHSTPGRPFVDVPVLASSHAPSDQSSVGSNSTLVPTAEHHAAILDLVTRLLRVNRLATARTCAAKLIADHLGASFVALGSNAMQTSPSPLAVIEGSECPSSEFTDDIEAALGECVVTTRAHQIVKSNSKLILKHSVSHCQSCKPGFAHQRLIRLLSNVHSIYSIPLLTDGGDCSGAVLVAWSNDSISIDPGSSHDQFLSSLSTPLAELLSNLERFTPSPFAVRWEAIRNRLTRQRKAALLATTVAAVAIGLIPVRYPVLASVSIQPSIRRWVAAPFDGVLKKSFVSPGREVKAGELLFTIDCEETLNKLASLRADAERSTSERSAHLSAGRLSEAAIAGWHAKGTKSEIELLTKQLDRAEIRSPIDGVVLGEDLQRLEGSPLKLGQKLVEVAQMDQMHAEIEVNPDQIFRVTVGSDVNVSVDSADAIPTLTLHQIHPRAEANEDGKYVFKGRAELPSVDCQLKPGLRGNATIYGQHRPLAWCFFQRLWQRLQNWT